ncbi:hypothetical protein IFM89_012794 [Coptis chinensis]|uniref:Protein SMG7 n=1 Tax=Coptis chinensis TaxID=261450 RepID=A0A835H5Y9_9MAGN|nr:hypothetical protein IFM89_012794 [Coptis chinensis]
MMTVPMDNLAAPPSRELVQRLYKKNIELENKRRKSAQARIPSDPNAWQQMRENYEAIILEDHAFSEQHEIEYALWQLHYRRIEELRAHFSAALASSGSATPGGPENVNVPDKDGNKHSEVKKGLMSCHRCLIYLGDLARYKGLYGEGDSKTREYAAASSYYMQAASLWPASGNPHHQLAILASYSGDDLGSIYRYFRSLAVNSPFTTARDNLIIAFEKNRQSYSQLPGDSKVSSVKTVPPRKTVKGRGKGETVHPPEDNKVEVTSIKERTLNTPEILKAFCVRFVRLNGVLFTRTSLETFEEIFSLVSRDLRELLFSGPEEELNFGTGAAENGLVIVRLIAILIFTVHNVNRETEGQSYAEILQRSVLVQNAFSAAFEFMGHILKRSIELNDPSSSYLLPGILVFIEWLACRPDIAVGSDVHEKQATARVFFWNQCTLFLNKLMSSRFVPVAEDEDETCFFNMSRYDEGETDNRLALWEDFELRGFLPLLPAQLILDFSRKQHTGGDGGSKEKMARVQRILAAGRALTNVVKIDEKNIYFDQKLKKFVIGVEPESADDFLVTSSSEMGISDGISQDHPVEMRNSALVPPSVMSYMEGEEDDEEIVFKPTIAEKIDTVPAPKSTTYKVIEPGENRPKAEWVSYTGSVSAPINNVSLQNTLDAIKQPLSIFWFAAQNQLPITSAASNWYVDQQAHLVNGVNNLSIAGNGFVTSSELKDGFGSSQPPAHSLPFPKPVNLPVNSIFSDQIIAPEAMIPSKFDSVMSSGGNTDSMTLNTSAALQASLRKNPVSRPVRHLGPPPGFSNVPPKQLDEFINGSNFRDENQLVDDYSWLDGYNLSSTMGMAPNNSINHPALMYPHVMNGKSNTTGTINFPFPGKQVPTMAVQDENQKNWQDYQLLEQLKIYQEQQQQQLQQANQQSALLPEQYQGQSLWSGRFFV